jgi:hypothetical protein
MPTFKIRATVETEVEIEADSLEEAIELVESKQATATHYAVEGVLGWNKVDQT